MIFIDYIQADLKEEVVDAHEHDFEKSKTEVHAIGSKDASKDAENFDFLKIGDAQEVK